MRISKNCRFETNPPARFQYQNLLPLRAQPIILQSSCMIERLICLIAYTLQAPEISTTEIKNIRTNRLTIISIGINPCQIRQKNSGLNEAFIINNAYRDELITQDPKSTEIIKPTVRRRDIKAYQHLCLLDCLISEKPQCLQEYCF